MMLHHAHSKIDLQITNRRERNKPAEGKIRTVPPKQNLQVYKRTLIRNNHSFAGSKSRKQIDTRIVSKHKMIIESVRKFISLKLIPPSNPIDIAGFIANLCVPNTTAIANAKKVLGNSIFTLGKTIEKQENNTYKKNCAHCLKIEFKVRVKLLSSQQMFFMTEIPVKDIKMVDLATQYQRLKPQIDSAMQKVLDETSFISGPAVKNFSQELASYLDVKYVIPCANGTDALQIALMALNLEPGDEVITSAFTFIATAEVIVLLGLKPVFVDVDSSDFTINVDQIANAITSKTKVILPVHLFGQCSNMEAILKLAAEKNIHVVEDTAQAIGAEYTFIDGSKKRAGTMGSIGTTSFFPSKNLGCFGDGGALMTNDKELADLCTQIANHGSRVRYYHDVVGINSRLDSLQAAVLSEKLKHLNDFSARRNKAAKFYDEAFQGLSEVKTPGRIKNSTHVFHQYTLQILNGKRDELKSYLEKKGIPAMVYYPLPLHQQNVFKGVMTDVKLPITEKLAEQVLSLPMHTELSDEQLNYICASVKEFFK